MKIDELQKLIKLTTDYMDNNGNLLIGSICLYYPYGRNRDSILVQIMDFDYNNNTFNVVATIPNGLKDADFMGFIFDVDGLWVLEDLLVCLN